jgi:hypothetical protein
MKMHTLNLRSTLVAIGGSAVKLPGIEKTDNRRMSIAALIVIVGFILMLPAHAQDSSAETKALDSTATQWSFQFAYQTMPDYHDDILSDGSTRPAGPTDYLQFRVVMPLTYDKFTILPRITLRHYENAQGESGIGNTEVFGLMIPKKWDWGTGRMGIGPLITLPGDKEVARDEWGYGFAAVWVNSKGNWFYGALLTQSWRSIDPVALPAGKSDTNPLGIAPIVNYLLGGGWYISNGDMVIQYDWDEREFKIPLGFRIGKVVVKEKGSWNYYFEYQTSAVYKDWPGAAVENSYRINVTYTIPGL